MSSDHDTAIALGGFNAALSWITTLGELPSEEAKAQARAKYKADVEANPQRLGFPLAPGVIEAARVSTPKRTGKAPAKVERRAPLWDTATGMKPLSEFTDADVEWATAHNPHFAAAYAAWSNEDDAA